ncbi:hypothetical protein DY000_02035699 [Brassica cretica]|uniref:DC1 domain-containing protein n=1 Tax=Brassica cretica TaxID=69181 RepID=A0ABQ7DPK0_BRACR|nr:hypothetical protein DY000_02035699 [Brassica cretica]
MEEIKIPFHEHLVRPCTRFLKAIWCGACGENQYRIYGGYRCNELGCDEAFHNECAEALPEIINSFHPEHPLTLIQDGGCQCIDLPRVININRHDHRISYTRRLGHGESPWKCGVCRKKVDGFYGAYTCSKCSTFVVHARCATRKDVWDNVELEGMPEEEVIAPFEVVDDSTIRHFSHDHNLYINKDGQILHENIVCEACVFQIGSESFYSCRKCDFILHEKCANLPRKKRHVCSNLPFTLNTVSRLGICCLCGKRFSGFRYESYNSSRKTTLDVQCGSISEPFVHESHPHP